MRLKKWNDEQLIEAVPNNSSYAGILKCLNLKPAGSNYVSIKRRITELGLDISHMSGQAWNTGKRYKPVKKIKSLESILVTNSSFTSSNKLRIRLLKEGIKKHCCELCNNTEWLGLKIPLELHHVNGIRNDNELQNIQLLCPNCHALTPNYRGKNKGAYS